MKSLILPITNSFEALKRALARVFRVPAEGKLKRLGRLKTIPLLGLMLVFCVLLALIMVFVDEPLARLARTIDTQSLVAQFFEVLTHLGTSGWVLIITGVMGIALSMMNWNAGKNFSSVRRYFNLYADANFVFFTVAISGTLVALIKNTIGRARPKHLDTLGPLNFDFAAFEASFASFPSGHSTTFGALCAAVAILHPRYRLICVLFAVLGGGSRVMVGAHYLSDVIAGLTFGAVFVIFAAHYLAKRRLMFGMNDWHFPTRRR